MGINGIDTAHSTPSIDVSLGSFSQQNSDQRGGRQSFSTALANTAVDSVELSSEAQNIVRKLQARDREVRAHEQAHLAASGGYAQGGANYTYTKGPDDKMYAIGGSVSLDVSPISGDPEATEKKARTIRAAALAPADPSAQDQSVAAQASAMAAQAQRDARAEDKEALEASSATSSDAATGAPTGASANAATTASTVAPTVAPTGVSARGVDAQNMALSGIHGATQAQGVYGDDGRMSGTRVQGAGAHSASASDTGLTALQAQGTSSASRVAFFRDSALSVISASDSMFFVSQVPAGAPSDGSISGAAIGSVKSAGAVDIAPFAHSVASSTTASLDKAHAAYQAQRNSALPQSGLAPAGTGISMHI